MIRWFDAIGPLHYTRPEAEGQTTARSSQHRGRQMDYYQGVVYDYLRGV